MKPADKQAYLEEYDLLKKKGKPFFPYAVLKDSAMMVLVVGVIILMSVILGAEQGPKADPTSTTYVPRPEWYFFFLFEVLRVIKPPELVPIATIGIPTICMVLLILTMTMAFTGYLLPFDQRSFWASIVGININGTGPVVGPYLSDFLRAGPELGATTLSRFYAIHMLLVPGAIIALIGAHLYLVVKLGTTAPPWLKAEKPKVAAPVSQLDAGTDGNGAAPSS